jgi:hypothetical protein
VQGWAYQGDLPSYTYAQARNPILYWGYNNNGDAQSFTIVNTPGFPALSLPYALGIPGYIGDRYVAIPGLPLRIALALPTFIREYVGARKLPDIYRLSLSGSPVLWFSVKSFTIRRQAFRRQLSIVIVPPGIATLTAIQSRYGNILTLYRGVVFPDGIEQIEPMMEVPLVTVRSDRGANQFSISMEGSIEETTNIAQTRVLRDISYRNTAAGGTRRIRCAVDTYLQPGYTVTFGGESMIVGEVTISVSPDSGVMEVAEVET